MEYAQALAWLDSLSDYAKPPVPYDRIKLRRMEALLAKLGSPQQKLPVAIVVAGTKGKGSTALMLQALLTGAGVKTGLYSKPHLHDYRERFRIGSRLISKREVTALLKVIRPAAEALASLPGGIPNYFEISVALAYLWFIRHQVRVAVLEAGIGGRLDAVHTAPARQVLFTPISYDHTHILGRTLPAIAGEKADLIPPRGIVWTAPQRPSALKILRRTARERGVQLLEAHTAVRLEVHDFSDRGTWFDAHTPWAVYPRLFLPLLGQHQLDNFTLALAGYESCSRLVPFKLNPDKVRRALAGLRWEGRIEVASRHPRVIIDVAHNEASIAALAQTLRQVFSWERIWVLLGLLQDKDARRILKALEPLHPAIIATQPRHPKALAAAKLANAAKRFSGWQSVAAIACPGAALESALQQAAAGDLIVITGSFYLAAELRATL